MSDVKLKQNLKMMVLEMVIWMQCDLHHKVVSPRRGKVKSSKDREAARERRAKQRAERAKAAKAQIEEINTVNETRNDYNK